MDKQITVGGWLVSPEQVPTTGAERIDWLYAWWERIDGWIAAQQ